QKADTRKIILYLTLIVGFVLGGIAGSLAFAKFQFSAMLASSVLTAVISVSYLLYWHHVTPKSSNG
ncbi:MAG: DUF1275 domain-containing protein, partial [Steroidobacteraceae bacterium]